MSYYKILNVLSTEVVHVWKSDCAVNTNFPLLPFQRNVAWEGREGGRGKKNKIRMEGRGSGERALGAKKLPCEWTPPPPSWVVLSTILSVLAEKQKLKIDCNFQFSIFRLPPKTEKLSHATDCNIVGKAKCSSVSKIWYFCTCVVKAFLKAKKSLYNTAVYMTKSLIDRSLGQSTNVVHLKLVQCK